MAQGVITPSIAKLLEGKNFVSFATLMEDGSPHVAPTWVDHDGDIILINTAMGRIKEKNIRKDPRVALSIYDQENPYNMVSIRGKVIEITTDGADDQIDKLAKRYFGVDKYPFRRPEEKRIILKIRPEKIHHQQPPPQK
ncbi:MAG TPA: PPOX class F420-dependent oxidoreductase [Candidatus Bathyarchaeia archaeon]|nr:PPOX class F420-dependent oxidoreductase [Candidatus Bathyarchaeia archaeon]